MKLVYGQVGLEDAPLWFKEDGVERSEAGLLRESLDVISRSSGGNTMRN